MLNGRQVPLAHPESNPLHPELDPCDFSELDAYEMDAMKAFGDSVGLNRQDSLDDALQLIKRDLAGELEPSPSPPLDFDTRFPDLSIMDPSCLKNVDLQVFDHFDQQLPVDPKQSMSTDGGEVSQDYTPVTLEAAVTPNEKTLVSLTRHDVCPENEEYECEAQSTAAATYVLYPGIKTPVAIEEITEDGYEPAEELEEKWEREDNGRMEWEREDNGRTEWEREENNGRTEWERDNGRMEWDRRRPVRPQSEQIGSRPAPTFTRQAATPDLRCSKRQSKEELTLGKPRRYERKEEPEKETDEYKVKRARNNHAVRRSRAKAKIHLDQLEQRVREQECEIGLLRTELRRKEKEIGLLKESVSAVVQSHTVSKAKRPRLH